MENPTAESLLNRAAEDATVDDPVGIFVVPIERFPEE